MKAELVFTGSELLLGHVLNTHAQYLGKRLSDMGLEIVLQTTVGDNWRIMEEVLLLALKRSDLIIVTGGLGPTTDDLTKEIVSSVTGLPLDLDKNTLDKLVDFYEKRGMKMTESMAKQALFPKGAIILPNDCGTAPGTFLEIDSKIIILLPGPPREMTAMFENYAVPYIEQKCRGREITKHKVLKLAGISESAVQEKIKDLGGTGNPEIAYVAKPGEIQVRVTARSKSAIEAEKMVNQLFAEVEYRLKEHIFGYDDELIEEVTGRLLTSSHLTLATAESCTGGLISAKLTSLPGSSVFYKGSVVAYSNEVKENLLGVPGEILAHYGAVSRETALAMAHGVRRVIGTDLGLSVTGIAGPSGGTPEKPVGLVYISLVTADRQFCQRYIFPGNRQAIRQGVSNAALDLVRRYLLGIEIFIDKNQKSPYN